MSFTKWYQNLILSYFMHLLLWLVANSIQGYMLNFKTPVQTEPIFVVWRGRDMQESKQKVRKVISFVKSGGNSTQCIPRFMSFLYKEIFSPTKNVSYKSPLTVCVFERNTSCLVFHKWFGRVDSFDRVSATLFQGRVHHFVPGKGWSLKMK